MRSNHATILNFTLKFGEKQNLRDYLDEIVKPAFLQERIRGYGRTTYQFLNVEEIDFGKSNRPDPAIIGTFVKNTYLVSEQKLVDGKLIEELSHLQSSPSATFGLFLNDHKLVYLADGAHAPDYGTFGTTVEKFVRDARAEHLDRTYKKEKAENPKTTRSAVSKRIKRPFLTVLPLPTDKSVAGFINSFKELKTLSFQIIEPNDEEHASEIFKGIKEQLDAVGAKGTLTARNPDGMPEDEAKDFVQGATNQGIVKVKATGTGEDGEKLVKTNADLVAEIEISQPDLPIRSRVRELKDRFEEMKLR